MFFTNDRDKRDKMIEYLSKNGYSDIAFIRNEGDWTYFEGDTFFDGRQKIKVKEALFGGLKHEKVKS